MDYFQTAIECNPKLIGPYINIGNIFSKTEKNDDALIFHINNPPVGEYVEKHLELAESIEIEIYGQLADDTIDILTQAWGEAKIPFKLFKTTRVGYFRQSIFG